MSRRLLAIGLVVSALVPSPLVAQGPAAADWRASDAAVDHRLTVPTAQTLPAGEVTLNSYELFLGFGVSVGATDWLEASASFALPLAGLVVAAKGRVVATQYVTASVQASFGWFPSESFSSNSLLFGGVALADFHTGNGEVSFCVGTGVVGVFQKERGDDSWADDELSPYYVVTGGPMLRVSRNVAFLIELAGAWSLGDPGYDGIFAKGFGSMTVNYGVRLHNASVALDLGMLRPLAIGWHDTWALGVPYAGLSVRF